MRKNLILDNCLIIISLIIVLLSFVLGTDLRSDYDPDYNLRRLNVPVNEEFQKSELMRDSINNILEFERMRKSDLGNAYVVGPLGITRFEGAMDWDSIAAGNLSPQKKHSFLVMAGYRLSPHSAFFLQDDKFFVKSAKITMIKKDLATSTYSVREIPVRYADAIESESSGFIMIPIKNSIYNVFNILIPVFGILIFLVSLYYVIIRPMQTLLNVGNGNVFGSTNTRNLRVAGWWLMGIALMPGLILTIFYLFITKKISPEIQFAFPDVFFDNKALILAAIIFLIVARAFAKGDRLQENNSSFI